MSGNNPEILPPSHGTSPDYAPGQTGDQPGSSVLENPDPDSSHTASDPFELQSQNRLAVHNHIASLTAPVNGILRKQIPELSRFPTVRSVQSVALGSLLPIKWSASQKVRDREVFYDVKMRTDKTTEEPAPKSVGIKVYAGYMLGNDYRTDLKLKFDQGNMTELAMETGRLSSAYAVLNPGAPIPDPVTISFDLKSPDPSMFVHAFVHGSRQSAWIQSDYIYDSSTNTFVQKPRTDYAFFKDSYSVEQYLGMLQSVLNMIPSSEQ
jgi:hypothetical protein